MRSGVLVSHRRRGISDVLVIVPRLFVLIQVLQYHTSVARTMFIELKGIRILFSQSALCSVAVSRRRDRLLRWTGTL